MHFSILKTIKNDMLVLFSLIGCIMFVSLGTSAYFFGFSFVKKKGVIVLDDEQRLLFGIIFLSLAILLLILMLLRFKILSSYYVNGQTIKGEITKIEYFKDRGYIHYEYSMSGNIYKGKVFIHKTKDTTKYNTNDFVTLLVNVDNNKKSIIKDFYS